MRLLRMRQNLEEQKLNFVKEMNRKDPNWQDKMKNRKLLEIQRMEQNRDKLKS
jgi:hypothetical protein